MVHQWTAVDKTKMSEKQKARVFGKWHTFWKRQKHTDVNFFFLIGCLRSFAPEDVLCVFLSLFFSSSFFFFSSLYIQSSPRFGLLPLSPSFSVTLFFTLSFCLLARMLSRLYVTSSENGVLPFPPPFPSSLAFVLFRSPSTTTHIYSRFPRTSSHSQDAWDFSLQVATGSTHCHGNDQSLIYIISIIQNMKTWTWTWKRLYENRKSFNISCTSITTTQQITVRHFLRCGASGQLVDFIEDLNLIGRLCKPLSLSAPFIKDSF